jgi:hypothetical protein
MTGIILLNLICGRLNVSLERVKHTVTSAEKHRLIIYTRDNFYDATACTVAYFVLSRRHSKYFLSTFLTALARFPAGTKVVSEPQA